MHETQKMAHSHRHATAALVGLQLPDEAQKQACVKLYKEIYPCGFVNDSIPGALIIPERLSYKLLDLLQARRLTYQQFKVPPDGGPAVWSDPPDKE